MWLPSGLLPGAPVQAAAPLLPAKLPHGQLTEVAPSGVPQKMGNIPAAVNPLPPFGTNPPQRPVTFADTDLTRRGIHNDPRELWYLALPQKMQPRQVAQILRSALGGDIWQQWQLEALMLDTWPLLRKCAHELREAVSQTEFKVRPWVKAEGEEPTKESQARADLVSKAIAGFKPNQFTDEGGFHDMVYDLTGALLSGMSMCEILWAEPTLNSDGTWERLPRASCWVHPRHFTFTNDGKLTVYDNFYNRLMFPLANGNGSATEVDPDKYLVAQYKSRSGSALGCGLIRPLGWYWSAVIFNRDWMFSVAQRYSMPFIEAIYSNAIASDQVELAKLEGFISEGLANGWIMHREGTELIVHPAAGQANTENPQIRLMEQADEACMILLLGQTSTTQGTPGKLGGEDVKENVKRERVEGLAKFLSEGPINQFARAVLRVNFGDDEMCPTIEADFTEVPEPEAEARVTTQFMATGMPLSVDDIYKKHKLHLPQQGDLVFMQGRIGKMADMNQVIGGQVDQFGMPLAGGGEPFNGFEFAGGNEPIEPEEKERTRAWPKPFNGFEFGGRQQGLQMPIGASAAMRLRAVLAKASPQQLAELQSLAVEARDSGERGRSLAEIGQIVSVLERKPCKSVKPELPVTK